MLFENTNPVNAPHDPTYHLTEDMAEKAIEWMRTSNTLNPGKPFFTVFYARRGAWPSPYLQRVGG